MAGATGVRFAAHWARPRANLHARRRRPPLRAALLLSFIYIYARTSQSAGAIPWLLARGEGRKRVRWSRNWFRQIAEVDWTLDWTGKQGRRRSRLPRHLILICRVRPSLSVCLRPSRPKQAEYPEESVPGPWHLVGPCTRPIPTALFRVYIEAQVTCFSMHLGPLDGYLAIHLNSNSKKEGCSSWPTTTKGPANHPQAHKATSLFSTEYTFCAPPFERGTASEPGCPPPISPAAPSSRGTRRCRRATAYTGDEPRAPETPLIVVVVLNSLRSIWMCMHDRPRSRSPRWRQAPGQHAGAENVGWCRVSSSLLLAPHGTQARTAAD